MDRHSRCGFLKASAFTTGAAMLGACPALAVGPPHMKFPTVPRERLTAAS
ncbi:MAG TPA: hypothetical protein VG206_07975 [Terriglobia bacterium]|nr:hypothetical protein [Terriglobia bacterium]